MTFEIYIAGGIIRVRDASAEMKDICRDYLCSEAEANQAKALSVSVREEEREHTSESLVIQYKIAEALPAYNTFLMHGAAAALDGFAYMFTAPSGTGKSTRTRLWTEEFPGSYIINGDRPYIRITETEALACGSPWCGKEGWNTNTMVPLKAIFLTERDDEGTGTLIREMDPVEAFPLLYRQTYHPESKEGTRKTLELLKLLEERVRIFQFRSRPTREGIQQAYEAATIRGLGNLKQV